MKNCTHSNITIQVYILSIEPIYIIGDLTLLNIRTGLEVYSHSSDIFICVNCGEMWVLDRNNPEFIKNHKATVDNFIHKLELDRSVELIKTKKTN